MYDHHQGVGSFAVTRARSLSIVGAIAISIVSAIAPLVAWGQAREPSTLVTVKHIPLSSLMYDERKGAGDNASVFMSTLTIPLDKFVLRLAFPKTSRDGSSLVRFRLDEGAVAAFTGGFLDTYAPATPAGLVRKGDKIYNQLDRTDAVMDAVICLTSDPHKPITITAVENYAEARAAGDCIQTGPYLVKDKLEKAKLEAVEAAVDPTLKFRFSTDPYQRSFLVLNARHEVIIGVAAPRVSLFALREFLRAPEKDGGFDAVEAVAMSGTRTAGLVIESNPEITAGSVQTLLPNAIVIERR